MIEITFRVDGVPPKKDGANSMWNKGQDQPRLVALRTAAARAMGSHTPRESDSISLSVTVCADRGKGDLDNFVTGICDGLMASHPRTPIDDVVWNAVPPEIHPKKPIVFVDDKHVDGIVAKRLPADGDPWYEVVVQCRAV